jgi:hypothetical protein
MIFLGDTGTASYPLSLVDGLNKQLEADGTAVKLTATSSTLTSSNIIGEIQRVYDAIPDTLVGNPGLVIMLANNEYKLYRAALANASAEVNFMQTHADADLSFLDVKLVRTPGQASKKIIAGVAENFILATDLVSDFEDIKILNQSNVTGIPTVRMVGNFKFGVTYLVGSEVVFYR